MEKSHLFLPNINSPTALEKCFPRLFSEDEKRNAFMNNTFEAEIIHNSKLKKSTMLMNFFPFHSLKPTYNYETIRNK